MEHTIVSRVRHHLDRNNNMYKRINIESCQHIRHSRRHLKDDEQRNLSGHLYVIRGTIYRWIHTFLSRKDLFKCILVWGATGLDSRPTLFLLFIKDQHYSTIHLYMAMAYYSGQFTIRPHTPTGRSEHLCQVGEHGIQCVLQLQMGNTGIC